MAGEGKIKNVRFSLRQLCAAFPEQRKQEQWGNKSGGRMSSIIQEAEDERDLAGKGEF